MKEWYLMTSQTKSTSLGGYENDAFLDYKDDAFAESLGTELGETIELFNCDLSERKIVRCMIQGNTPDSQLKSVERIGLFVRGTVKSGMYVRFEDCYWLITGYPSYNKVYEKVVMQLCQHKLCWQNDSGQIIERWCNVTSASKYDVGESGNNAIILGSNNYTILVPDDDESYYLDGKRVFIDRNTINPTKTFKLTRSDDVLYNYGITHGGIFGFIADKSELNYETDRQDLGICDYKDTTVSPTKPIINTQMLKATMYGRNNITIGYARKYSVKFKNEINDEVDVLDFVWNIDCDFSDKIEMVNEGSSLKVVVSDKECIGKTFKVQVIRNTEIMTEKTVIIEDTY